MVAVAMIPALLGKVRRQSKTADRIVPAIPGVPTLSGAIRYLFYRKTPSSRWMRSRSWGSLLIIASFSIATIAWCFSVHPYYRPNREWGSPPLAVRSGMIAQGMLPFLFALSMKVNPISILTHISHEKLQVYHQWMARLFVFFGVVHTIPFLWQPDHDDAPETLRDYWFGHDYLTYWTGTVCLAILFWMLFSSTGWARNRSYEFFVIQHIISTLVFVVLYFYHCGDALDSWLWLWACIGIWALSTLLKWSRSLATSNFFVGFRATVEAELVHDSNSEVEPERIVRLALRTPIKWKAGQHVFIRFPTVAPLQSHPFTIASLPASQPAVESMMVLVARCHSGVTRRLFETVQSKGERPTVSPAHADEKGSIASSFRTGAISLPVVIDGPYGEQDSVWRYQSALLIAGGIGITRVLASIMDVCAVPAGKDIKLRHLKLVWTVRRDGLLNWFEDQLDTAFEILQQRGIEVEFVLHFSQQDPTTTTTCASLAKVPGRPEVAALVKETVSHAESQGCRSLHITACGPASLNRDCSNSVARAEKRLILGAAHSSLLEIVLADECFGY